MSDDVISRLDAIEAIASRDETNGTVKVFTGRQVNEILASLPTAEPKTGEWIIATGMMPLLFRMWQFCKYGTAIWKQRRLEQVLPTLRSEDGQRGW